MEDNNNPGDAASNFADAWQCIANLHSISGAIRVLANRCVQSDLAILVAAEHSQEAYPGDRARFHAQAATFESSNLGYGHAQASRGRTQDEDASTIVHTSSYAANQHLQQKQHPTDIQCRHEASGQLQALETCANDTNMDLPSAAPTQGKLTTAESAHSPAERVLSKHHAAPAPVSIAHIMGIAEDIVLSSRVQHPSTIKSHSSPQDNASTCQSHQTHLLVIKGTGPNPNLVQCTGHSANLGSASAQQSASSAQWSRSPSSPHGDHGSLLPSPLARPARHTWGGDSPSCMNMASSCHVLRQNDQWIPRFVSLSKDGPTSPPSETQSDHVTPPVAVQPQASGKVGGREGWMDGDAVGGQGHTTGRCAPIADFPPAADWPPSVSSMASTQGPSPGLHHLGQWHEGSSAKRATPVTKLFMAEQDQDPSPAPTTKTSWREQVTASEEVSRHGAWDATGNAAKQGTQAGVAGNAAEVVTGAALDTGSGRALAVGRMATVPVPHQTVLHGLRREVAAVRYTDGDNRHGGQGKVVSEEAGGQQQQQDLAERATGRSRSVAGAGRGLSFGQPLAARAVNDSGERCDMAAPEWQHHADQVDDDDNVGVHGWRDGSRQRTVATQPASVYSWGGVVGGFEDRDADGDSSTDSGSCNSSRGSEWETIAGVNHSHSDAEVSDSGGDEGGHEGYMGRNWARVQSIRVQSHNGHSRHIQGVGSAPWQTTGRTQPPSAVLEPATITVTGAAAGTKGRAGAEAEFSGLGLGRLQVPVMGLRPHRWSDQGGGDAQRGTVGAGAGARGLSATQWIPEPPSGPMPAGCMAAAASSGVPQGMSGTPADSWMREHGIRHVQSAPHDGPQASNVQQKQSASQRLPPMQQQQQAPVGERVHRLTRVRPTPIYPALHKSAATTSATAYTAQPLPRTLVTDNPHTSKLPPLSSQTSSTATTSADVYASVYANPGFMQGGARAWGQPPSTAGSRSGSMLGGAGPGVAAAALPSEELFHAIKRQLASLQATFVSASLSANNSGREEMP